jgi:hypothetical protein
MKFLRRRIADAAGKGAAWLATAIVLLAGSTVSAKSTNAWKLVTEDYLPGVLMAEQHSENLSVTYFCDPNERHDALSIQIPPEDIEKHFPGAGEVGVRFTWDETGGFTEDGKSDGHTMYTVARINARQVTAHLQWTSSKGSFSGYDEPFDKLGGKSQISLFDARLSPATLTGNDYKLRYVVSLEGAKEVLAEIREKCRGGEQISGAEPTSGPAGGKWEFYVLNGAAYAKAPEVNGMRLMFSCSDGRPAFLLQIEESVFPKQLAALERVFVFFDVDASGNRRDFTAFSSKVSAGRGLKEVGTAARGTLDVARRMGRAQRNIVVGLSDGPPKGDFKVYNMTEFSVAGSSKAVKGMLEQCGAQ